MPKLNGISASTYENISARVVITELSATRYPILFLLSDKRRLLFLFLLFISAAPVLAASRSRSSGNSVRDIRSSPIAAYCVSAVFIFTASAAVS